MPANPLSLRITDAYRERLGRLEELARRLGQWTVNGDDIDGIGKVWLDRVIPQLEVIQGAGVTLTSGYVAAYLASETGDPVAPIPVDDTTVGQSQDGQPLVKALTAALITVKMAIGDGRARQEALQLGEQRATRIISDAAMAAPRDALHSAIQRDEFAGWRRVTAGGCGACLAAAENVIHGKDRPLRVHSNCKCTVEPVVQGVAESMLRPTGREIFDGMTPEQQNALLGDEKAELVRTGQVPFERLIQPQPMAVAPDGITERPLQALTA